MGPNVVASPSDGHGCSGLCLAFAVDHEHCRVARTVIARQQVRDRIERQSGELQPTVDRRPPDVHRNGPDRERDNDRVLLEAGIRPGDPSLYPSPLRRS